MPRDRLDTLAREPIGTGPFKFKSFTPGDRVELVKNPDYYVQGRAASSTRSSCASCRKAPRSPRRSRPAKSISSGTCRWSRSTQFKKNPNLVDRFGPDVDLGRHHHEQRAQAVQRSARSPRDLAGDRQARDGRAGAVRLRHADAHDDPAGPSVLQQRHQDRHARHRRSAKKLLAEAGLSERLRHHDLHARRPADARACRSRRARDA